MEFEIGTIASMYQGALVLLTLLSISLWGHINRTCLLGYIVSNLGLVGLIQIHEMKDNLPLEFQVIILLVVVTGYFIAMMKMHRKEIFSIKFSENLIWGGGFFVIILIVIIIVSMELSQLTLTFISGLVLMFYTALVAIMSCRRNKNAKLKAISFMLLCLGLFLMLIVPVSFEFVLPLGLFVFKDALFVMYIIRLNKQFNRRVLKLNDIINQLRGELDKRIISENQLHRSIKITEESLLQYSLIIDSDKKLMKEINHLLKTSLDNSCGSCFKTIIRKLDKREKGDYLSYFESQFQHFNKEFFGHLIKQYPQLTPNERRLCAFLKMNLNSKEISALTGKSPGSIDVSRYRLRKKIGAKTNEKLLQLLMLAEG